MGLKKAPFIGLCRRQCKCAKDVCATDLNCRWLERSTLILANRYAIGESVGSRVSVGRSTEESNCVSDATAWEFHEPRVVLSLPDAQVKDSAKGYSLWGQGSVGLENCHASKYRAPSTPICTRPWTISVKQEKPDVLSSS